MAKIIALMGIDGSGKSYLGNTLKNELTTRGEKSVVVWACLRPFLLRPFIKAAKYFFVRKKNKFTDYKAHIEAKRKGLKKFSWTHGIYFYVMLIDYLPQALYKVYLPHLMGYHVICDRYYHDLIMDYGITTNASTTKVLKLINFIERLVPRPDLTYLISISPEIAYERKDDIPAVEYLTERAELYAAIADSSHAKTLDGSRPIIENCTLILDEIDNMQAS